MNVSVKLFAGIVIAGLISHLPLARAAGLDHQKQQAVANYAAHVEALKPTVRVG